MTVQDPYRVPSAARHGLSPVYDQGYPGVDQRGPDCVPGDSLGVAALVLGILAVLTSWTVVGGCVLGGCVLGVGAIVLGAVGRGRARRGEATNGGLATAGIVTGSCVCLSAALMVFGATLQQLQRQDLHQVRQAAAGNTAAIQQPPPDSSSGPSSTNPVLSRAAGVSAVSLN